MKGSTNKKTNFQNKIQDKKNNRDNKFNSKSKKTDAHQYNKAMPPTSQSIETLPTLSNLAAVSKEQRSSYANKVITNMLQFLPNYIAKKEGSRVVQTLIKWADEKVKHIAFDTLKSHWKQMIRGKYSVFVLKLLVRNVNIPQLVDSCDTLQGIYEAAVVLDTFVKHTATGDQIQAIKKHFMQLINSQDQKKQQVIDNIIMKAVQQNYYHLTMSKFIFRSAIHKLVENERIKVLQCLRPVVVSLIYDIEGVKLFFQVYNYSNTKDRKDIIKLIKADIQNIINSGSSTAHMALLKLLHSTDDTVLIQKSIIKQLKPFISNIYEDKRIQSIVFSVFSPLNHNNNIMHKWEPKINYTTNKKSHEQRIQQVRGYMIESVIESIKQKQLHEALSNEQIQRLVIGLIAYVSIDNNIEEYTQWVKQILDCFVNDTKKVIEKDDKTYSDTALVCQISAHRVLKYLITMISRTSQKVSSLIENCVGKIQTLFLKHLNKVLHSRSSYILIAIMQQTSNKDLILDSIKKSKINLNDVVGGQIYKSQ